MTDSVSGITNGCRFLAHVDSHFTRTIIDL